MNKLYDASHTQVCIVFYSACSGTQQYQHRSHPLATRCDDIVADTLDQRNVGVQLVNDKLIDRFEVSFDGGADRIVHGFGY